MKNLAAGRLSTAESPAALCERCGLPGGDDWWIIMRDGRQEHVVCGDQTADQTDSERLDWLEEDHSRLEDVRGRCNNEGTTVREAIDHLSNAVGVDTPSPTEADLRALLTVKP